MNKFSERRMVENEAIFRKINTEGKDFVLEAGEKSPFYKKPLRFYCECSNMDCLERIKMTAQEYDKIHQDIKKFIIKPGHDIPEVENIVTKTEDYAVVEKIETPQYIKKIDPKRLLEPTE